MKMHLQHRWCLMALGMMLMATIGLAAETAPAPSDPPEKDRGQDGKKPIAEGTFIGTVKGKLAQERKAWVDVTSDSSQKVFQFIPEWKGGANGGLDKRIVKIIDELKEGDKVVIVWYVNDHIRIKSIKKAE